jgi:hypothetical protein
VSNRLGKLQRRIIAALRDGAVLYNESGLWYWQQDSGTRHDVTDASCLTLYTRGFVMADGMEAGVFSGSAVRVRYVLTERGKTGCRPITK